MTDSILAIAQSIVDGKWMHAADARRAARRGTYLELLREIEPPPPAIRFLRAAEYRRCVEAARAVASGPHSAKAELVPIWIGENPDDEPSSDWFLGHAFRLGSGDLGVSETGPVLEDASDAVDRALRLDVTYWTVGHIVRSAAYAPAVELELRGACYAVLEGNLIQVDSATPLPGEPLPRPSSVIRPFCRIVAPRVTHLGDALEREIAELSIIVDDEGEIAASP